jgi:SMC interacting uncharacterized protein involved in chromosome segregation
MERPMAPENRRTADEAFRELENQLATLRTTSKTLREKRPSWSENFFHPGRRAKDEAEFGAAIVSAMKEFGSSIRNALAEQESKLAELARQISTVRSEQADLSGLREHHEQLAKLVREQAEAAAAATKSAAEMQHSIRQIEQSGREQGERVEQLASGQNDLANEFRERIQHLLDEQRVAIRQLALKASEDAVLSDRARRATELKLEELAKRVPPAPPA